jgi:hypothetical protein
MKENFDFFELLEKNKESDKIVVEFEKAVKLGEVIAFHNVYSYEDLNVFTDELKELSCLSDEKRDWLGQPACFGELLENTYDSVPKTISQQSELRKKGRKADRILKWQKSIELENLGWAIERMQLL